MFTYKKLLKLNQFAVTCLLLIMIISCNQEQKSDYLNESSEKFDQRMEWWRDAGFGMFIHWGAYAVPAGVYKGEEIPGIGEWIMDKAQIPIPEYEKFARQFNPV
ncbi:MAG: alpha-L-fucosidase, partial [Bacteroidales bacterium]|nr:alpha-L-fucosidase [Bacteroidales bacterium]